METYNGVLERMGSRFMVNGKIAGKLFIVSSKKSEYDFLESYIKKKADDPSVLVCDAKLWEVKPTGTYSGNTFLVAVGGSNLPSRIIPLEECTYTVKVSDGKSVTFRHNDLVTLKDGTKVRIQDLKEGDDIQIE